MTCTGFSPERLEFLLHFREAHVFRCSHKCAWAIAFGLVATILAMGHVSTHQAAQTAVVLWSADMETNDLGQWSLPDVPSDVEAGGGIFNSGDAQVTIDRVAHTGHHSAKLAITTHGTGASGARLFRWKEPQNYSQLYYSAWYYFPRRYISKGTPPWWNVFQWKSKHHDGIDPFFSLNVGNLPDGSMFFYLYDQNTRTSFNQALATIPEQKWLRVEAFYSCASDNSGHVAFWQDGVQIFDISNAQTRYPDGDCQWSVNNYSNRLEPSTAVIYVDDAAICLGDRCP